MSDDPAAVPTPGGRPETQTQPTSGGRTVLETAEVPRPAAEHDTPVTGDSALDTDVANLTAAAPGRLDGVVEMAGRLHGTLQQRLSRQPEVQR